MCVCASLSIQVHEGQTLVVKGSVGYWVHTLAINFYSGTLDLHPSYYNDGYSQVQQVGDIIVQSGN